MESDSDISVDMAYDAIKYIYNTYPDLSCREYMDCASLISILVSRWVGEIMNKKSEEVLNDLLSKTIQMDILERKMSEGDDDGLHSSEGN